MVTTAPASGASLHDPQDGWLDVSEFLDTAYGFLPLVMPITEPAVGYGAAGALVFIDRDLTEKSFTRPNIAVVGGLATENGTQGVFAAHLATWMEGRLRTTAALASVDVNLEFFGLGGQHNPGEGLDYSMGAAGGTLGGSYRLTESGLWMGLRYVQANTSVIFDPINATQGLIQPQDRNVDLGALTPSVTLDRRNNFFTPTRGWYVDLSMPIFREGLGGDRDFETATLITMYYRPLSESLFFSVRGDAKSSSDGTPFFLRPFVWLRGVPSLGYQGETVLEAEAEFRWQFHPRFSLVGFGGTGVASSDTQREDDSESVSAGGVGFRYLMARKYGLHMGLDLAFGPDEPVIYVVFGSAWVKP